MRADRLLSILLLLQAHGRMPARELSRRLEVSERTIYRDLDALGAAGVPVYTERGRHGGCAIVDGYRTDLTGLTGIEARTLFAARAVGYLSDLGLGDAGVHGDVELTHLRQDNMTLLFQAVRTWRVLSSLVDAERRGRQAGSRGVKLTWRSLGQISLALTPARLPC